MTTPAIILQPGLHLGVEEKLYHSDPAPVASLSASIGKEIVSASPKHAYLQHPRLGKKDDEDDEDNAKMDFGSVGHKLLLGAGKQFVVGDFKNWATNDAKDFRKRAKVSGLVGILKHQHERALAMREGVREDLARQNLLSMFDDGQSEVVAITKDYDAPDLTPGAYCRIMIDKLTLLADGHQAFIFDLKVSEVAPQNLRRHVGEMYYDQRAAFYVRNLAKVMPKAAGRIRYIFLFAEPNPPFCVIPLELSGAFRAIGDSRCDRAIELWKRCISTGKWPGYTTGPISIEPTSWQETAEQEACEGFSAVDKI